MRPRLLTTAHGPLRAIALAIFLGCAPDLDRSVGSLDVAIHVGVSADLVRVHLRAGSADADRTLPVAPFVEVPIDGLPAGSVMLEAQAIAAGAVVASDSRAAVVERGSRARVEMRLGNTDGGISSDAAFDAGPPDSGTSLDSGPPDSGLREVRSGLLRSSLRMVREDSISGSEINQTSDDVVQGFTSFVSDARGILGGQPRALQPRAVEVELERNIENVPSLTSLFSGDVTVFALVGSSQARTNLAVGRVSGSRATLVATGASLAPLSEALNGEVKVGLRGPTSLTSEDRFEADLTVWVDWAAVE